MIDIISYALKNIGRKKGRSFLTSAGIAIGVASVILIGNISQCGANAINTELDSLGLSGLTISTSSFDSGYSKLTQDELKIVLDDSDVERAMPIMIENTAVYDKKDNELNTILWGIDSSASQIISLKLLYGRYINNTDVNAGSNVCMVDEKFSREIYGRDNIVGKSIPILCGGNVEDYKIVGIIKTGSGLLQNFIGDYIPNFIYLPYSTMQNTTGRKSFDQIAIKTKKDVDTESVGRDIVQKLVRNTGNSNYQANNLSKQKQGLTNLLNIVTIILSAVGAVSLLVASLSIMTVMLVSVNERTREIGIKKSIGAKKKDILLEFLLEAIFLSAVGCVTGVVVGSVISYVGAALIGLYMSMRVDIILVSSLASMVTGAIFGVYPAYRASKLSPVDALRTE